MKRSDLENNLKNKKQIINEIANYVMYEQAIIKKDNYQKNSSINYNYEKESNMIINSFLSRIDFISKPVIGSAKKVIINNFPNDYNNQNNQEIPLKDKIYILDKIKDSFMHLQNDETMYEIDNENIYIKNINYDYSLECKIPFNVLHYFNSNIKTIYDNSTPALDWIDKFQKSNGKKQIQKLITKNDNLYQYKAHINKRVLYNPEKDYYYFFEKRNSNPLKNLSNGISKQDYDSYHTDSYVSLLIATSEEMNYPIINNLYDFDFSCQHITYTQKMKKIMKKTINFYNTINSTIEYLDQDELKNRILDFLLKDNSKKEEGLISDISFINNMIIKNYMRNARSHANNKGVKNSKLGEELIIYKNVLYNSIDNNNNEKNIPNFILIGKRKDLNIFFRKIRFCSMTNKELYDQITNNEYSNENNYLSLFLDQLNKFINQCKKDNIIDIKPLKKPIGNAKNFVDFIQKIMNESFKYKKGKTKILKK